MHPNCNLFICIQARLLLEAPDHQTQAYSARSLSVAAPSESLWNSLPVGIKNAQTLFSFKRKLKTYLFNQL